MKHYEQIEVPQKVIQRLLKTTCDLCGNEVDPEGNCDVDEVMVSRVVGERYPDCADLWKHSVDMCGPCFDTKLVPWLKEQGVTTIQLEDVGY